MNGAVLIEIKKLNKMKNTQNIKQRLEELKLESKNECISYDELAELQFLAEHIDENDVELLQAAGVDEIID